MTFYVNGALSVASTAIALFRMAPYLGWRVTPNSTSSSLIANIISRFKAGACNVARPVVISPLKS